jgi:hypothetical protein
MGLRFDYENEIQFQFQLEIVPSRADGSQQIENEGPKWESSKRLIPSVDNYR